MSIYMIITKMPNFSKIQEKLNLLRLKEKTGTQLICDTLVEPHIYHYDYEVNSSKKSFYSYKIENPCLIKHLEV